MCRKAAALEVSEPQLPRFRKQPRRFDEGLTSGEAHKTPKAHFRPLYYEAIDRIVNCIQDRFDQPGYRIYQSLEALLTKACKQEELDDDLEPVCTFYKDDFDRERLQAQLQTFSVHFLESQGPLTQEHRNRLPLFDAKTYLLPLSITRSDVSLLRGKEAPAADTSHASHERNIGTLLQCTATHEKLSQVDNGTRTTQQLDGASCSQRQN